MACVFHYFSLRFPLSPLLLCYSKSNTRFLYSLLSALAVSLIIINSLRAHHSFQVVRSFPMPFSHPSHTSSLSIFTPRTAHSLAHSTTHSYVPLPSLSVVHAPVLFIMSLYLCTHLWSYYTFAFTYHWVRFEVLIPSFLI